MIRQNLHSSDRKLGDEWLDWNEESVNQCHEDTEASRAVYLGFSALAVILLLITAYFFNYLAEPRLAELHDRLPYIVSLCRITLSAVIIVWFFLIVLSVLTKRDLGFLFIGKQFLLLTFSPTIMKLGHRFGVSRDLLSSSFIKVSNSIVKAASKHKIITKPLLLLPRCLKKSQLQYLISLARRLGCEVCVVSGGEAARRAIVQKQPAAVIGVACERDLLSGIRDTIKTVPVLGIANKRPEGPCKNTIVDCDKVEEAIRFFFDSATEHKVTQGF